jgi:AcrR family transcriptional regulator
MSTAARLAPEPNPRHSRRERILGIAAELFAAKGYENTSTLSIARSAGTSETQLMKHFINKEGLLEAIFAEQVATMLKFLSDAKHLPSPRERLREFFHLAVSWLDQHPEQKKLFLLDLRRVRSKHTGEVLAGLCARDFVVQIDELLQEARVAGELKCSMRVSLVRSVIFGAVSELLRDAMLSQSYTSPATSDEIDKTVTYIFSVLFESPAIRL